MNEGADSKDEDKGGEPAIEGGCLCGAIRYRIDGRVAPPAHCHCSMCRRSTGAVVVTWLTAPAARFRFVRGSPTVYVSSSTAERHFCGRCGAQLIWRSRANPASIDVTVGTLDHPERYPPDHHVFAGDRVPWLRLDETLVGYPGETPPEHPGPRAPGA